jgi:hypothetical protein
VLDEAVGVIVRVVATIFVAVDGCDVAVAMVGSERETGGCRACCGSVG